MGQKNECAVMVAYDFQMKACEFKNNAALASPCHV